jgi:hypothetical protein
VGKVSTYQITFTKGVIGVIFEPKAGYMFVYDTTNKKVLAYEPLTTPTGAVAAPVFTGAELATHQHDAVTAGTPAGTVSQPTFSATGKSAKIVRLHCGATACDNTDSENADSASDITSLDAAVAYAAVAAAAWTHGAITNPGVPRNVAITIKNDSGGALNLYEGVMTFTITGTNYKGEAQTETITFTSAALDKEIANIQWRFKFGLKAFATITDVTLDNVPDNDLDIGVGFGGKISLLGNLATPAEADVIQALEDGAIATITSNVDTTNMTFNFDAIATNKIVEVTYLTTTGESGTVSQPTFTGAEMSTHQHAAKTAGTPAGTNSAPAFTGNEVATHAEAGNADNLSALTGVRWVAWGY